MLFKKKRNELKRPCKYARDMLKKVDFPCMCSGNTAFPERCKECRMFAGNYPDRYAKIVHAKWIERGRSSPHSQIAICDCSACGAYCWVYDNPDRRFLYCPFCGAKMDEEEGEQT